MDVGGERRQEQAGEAADTEEEDEAEAVEHRRDEPHRALVHRGQPIEDLDGRWYGDSEGDGREDEARELRLAAREHVVAPNQKAQQRDGERRDGDELVAEDGLATVDGDEL